MLEFRAARGGEQFRNTARVERAHLDAFNPGRFNGVDRIAHEDPRANRPTTQRPERIEDVRDRALREASFFAIVTAARRPTSEPVLDVRRPERLCAMRPQRGRDVETNMRGVAGIGASAYTMLGRCEPPLCYIGNRQPCAVGITAALYFPKNIPKPALRLSFRTAERLAPTYPMTIQRSR